MIYYDIERQVRPSDQPWFICAKCGAHVTESEWASLCQECGKQEADADFDFASTPHPRAHYEVNDETIDVLGEDGDIYGLGRGGH